ncbi:hypothetical protein ACWATR_37215 [Nostoc sp. UIC 10890]
MSGVNFAILGVCMVLAVECYPKLGVGDCDRGGEARSPSPDCCQTPNTPF